MQRRWFVLPLTVLAAALTGCNLSDFGDSTRYREDFHQSYPMKPGGRLYLENLNGSVEIAGWDQDTADISGTKHARSEQTLQALRIDVVASGDSIRVRTVRPSGHSGSMGASYLIRVPRRTALERIQSSNGRIQVTGIEGAARLETSNGSIEANDLSGALVARTSNGAVRVGRVLGELNITTSNGSIRASTGKLERPVTLHTSNGSIELSVEALGGSGVNASTSNASITLRLPSSTAASLTASTSNGSITNQFESEFRGRTDKNHLDGTIGAGGPRVRLDTSNGSIRLLRL